MSRFRMSRYDAIQEVRKIMGSLWDDRIDKDRPLAEQIREMARWKPVWFREERPLAPTEIEWLNAVADAVA
jgi:hypothetical protein